MGKLMVKNTTPKKKTGIKDTTIDINSAENGLYKPLDDFKWKDASQVEIHQNSIEAYKKYAF